jgi:hypothetical protein
VARPAPPAVPAPQARLHADDADVPDVSIPDVGAIVERSVAEAMTKLNQAMASSEKGRAAAAGVRTGFAKCAAEGGDRNAVLKRCYGVDMEQIHNQVLSGLEEARNELKASEDLSQAQRDKAVRSLEHAIARLKNDPHWAK